MIPSSLSGFRSYNRLYQFFVLAMISLRYRGQIIVRQIISVQTSYSASVVGGALLGTTVLKSYFPQGTSLKSYLDVWSADSILIETYLPLILLVPLIGVAKAGNRSNASLSEFTGSSTSEENEQKENKIDWADQVKQLAKAAYGYARQSQSSVDGDNDTSSISVQKDHIFSASGDNNLEIAHIFVDMNESGFSFDREGFNNLIEHLEQEPRPIVLDRVNRLGRNTLETIYVAATIHYEYNVPIITYRNGMYDLDSTSDQITLVVEAITAGKSVEDRIRAAWDTITRKFEEESA